MTSYKNPIDMEVFKAQALNKDNLKLTCGNKVLDLSSPKIMGILNLTPDSFSDGGKYNDFDKALVRVEQMLDEGADIVDLGGESTRPGAQKVSVEEELDRVIPVIEAINARFDTLISVDTSQAQVFLESKRAGAHIINDVRSLELNGALEALQSIDLPVCIMHYDWRIGAEMDASAQSKSERATYLQDVRQFFDDKLKQLAQAGIERNRIILDPGFGFAKDTWENMELLNKLAFMQEYRLPMLIGLSRKRFLGDVSKAEVLDRDSAGLAANLYAYIQGGHIFRVHNVKDTVNGFRLFERALIHK